MPTSMVKATNIGPNGTKGFKPEASSQKSCDQIYPVRVTEKSVESILCGIRRYIMSHLDVRKQVCSTRTDRGSLLKIHEDWPMVKGRALSEEMKAEELKYVHPLPFDR